VTNPDLPSPVAPPAWTRVAARAVGVWILAGCLAKAFLGTPGDLPEVVQKAPLALGTTFSLVLAVEAFVGLATILRPGRAWVLAELLLVAFAVVLATQIASGAHSCGCFGATIPVPPWLMFGLDLVFSALLVAAKPWRFPRGGRGDLVSAAVAVAVAVALPLAVNREAKPGETPRDGMRRFAVLDFRSWKGKRVAETDLAAWADLSTAQDGEWILWRPHCEVCADCLERMTALYAGDRPLTLVQLGERPKPGVPPAVHALPEGPLVRRIDLPDTVDWAGFTPPARLFVEAGVVKDAREDVRPDDCR
jgi:hypothetical protein